MEIDSTGALVEDYVYSGARLLATERGGTTYFHHQDRLSTRLLTNSAGAVVGTSSHLPYGEDGLQTGVESRHKFTTYDRDGETDNDYAMNRHSSPSTGRFMQPDPIAGSKGMPQSLNRFTYAMDDPINLVDPTGLWPRPPRGGSRNPYDSYINPQFGGTALYEGLGSLSWNNGDLFYEFDIDAYLDARALALNPALAETLFGLGHFTEQTIPLQGIGPYFPLGTPQGLQAIFLLAFADARSRIVNNPDCAAQFGGVRNALNHLDYTTYRLVSLGGPSLAGTLVGAQTVGLPSDRGNVQVNTQGPVFHDRAFFPGEMRERTIDFNTGYRGAVLGAVVILHELGHQTGSFPTDADDGVNRANTQRVLDHCFP